MVLELLYACLHVHFSFPSPMEVKTKPSVNSVLLFKEDLHGRAWIYVTAYNHCHVWYTLRSSHFLLQCGLYNPRILHKEQPSQKYVHTSV